MPPRRPTAPKLPSAAPIPVATVGYEGATLPALLDALRGAGVALLVDVRAVARSRRPGFAKSRLAAALAEAGVDYRHLRGLGTPADGRAAARAGRHAAMRAVYRAHLGTAEAQADLDVLAGLAAARHVCLLCFEADPRHCHRLLVADALAARLPVVVTHLRPSGATASA
ncbi:hypothetical protein tb265_39790 [Gemmatimonadetes bacterium T265]|nr:hypothetical protein tb265_39790 [Gemmatimonadetes bacterium T265]